MTVARLVLIDLLSGGQRVSAHKLAKPRGRTGLHDECGECIGALSVRHRRVFTLEGNFMRLFMNTGWTRLAATLTAVLALGMSGCSDDDSSSSGSSGGTGGMSSGGSGGQAQQMDIVDTAVAAGNFNTLVAAVQAAGLEDTLRSGTFTVFAPTDAAFDALPEGTVDTLLKPENKDQLTAILTYHAVAGEVRAADVVKLDKATTVNGADITIEVVDGKVILNGTVEVTTTDIETSNGIIHVIDGVLLPPEG